MTSGPTGRARAPTRVARETGGLAAATPKAPAARRELFRAHDNNALFTQVTRHSLPVRFFRSYSS